MKHFQIQFEPDRLEVKVHKGATLFEAAGQAGIVLLSPCGGVGRCGKCKVLLLPSKKEVLACQHTIEHDMSVLIPDSSRFFKQQILEHGIQRTMDGPGCVQKIQIEQPSSTLQALCDSLSDRISGQIIVHQKRKETLVSQLNNRQNDSMTAILLSCPATISSSQPCFILSGLETGNTTENLFGLAVDIGTTTVVARLVNLNTNQVMATASAGNPQGQFGADVISRISYSENNGGLQRLHQIIIECINKLIIQTTERSDIKPRDIYEIVAAGNTTMNHLFLRYPVIQLGRAPYEAHCLKPSDHTANELGLEINPAGNIHTIANIAGFVGSDTIASVLSCGMDITEINTLLVDIGTNGEIVYGTRDNLLAASCAAGPALEGAGIEFGSRAQAGAIERVLFDGNDIDVDIIGNGQAHSICGSGLIDAVAVMLELGIIDSTGRFCEVDELNPLMPDAVRNRLILHGGKPAFVLAGTFSQEGWKNWVLLTQKDIRQMQLAKSAIRAGIELLLKQANTRKEKIQQVLLAGAFGNYVDKQNAVRIGLLPNISLNKIHFVGNAAGSGAEMVLISQRARNLAIDLAQKIKYIEIAHQSEFQIVFSEFLMFPEQ